MYHNKVHLKDSPNALDPFIYWFEVWKFWGKLYSAKFWNDVTLFLESGRILEELHLGERLSWYCLSGAQFIKARQMLIFKSIVQHQCMPGIALKENSNCFLQKNSTGHCFVTLLPERTCIVVVLFNYCSHCVTHEKKDPSVIFMWNLPHCHTSCTAV